MALNYGTKWAIYMLLSKHTGNHGVQSRFRTTVNNYVTQKMSITDAVTKAAQEQIDPTIQAGDIKPLQSVTSEDLRAALSMDSEYDPTQGDCPGDSSGGDGNGGDGGDGGDGGAAGGDVVDQQQAIVNALVGMTGPVIRPKAVS